MPVLDNSASLYLFFVSFQLEILVPGKKKTAQVADVIKSQILKEMQWIVCSVTACIFILNGLQRLALIGMQLLVLV